MQSQGLVINDVTVRFAAQMLDRLFFKGTIQNHGALINLESMPVNPIAVNFNTWLRFGFREKRKRRDAWFVPIVNRFPLACASVKRLVGFIMPGLYIARDRQAIGARARGLHYPDHLLFVSMGI